MRENLLKIREKAEEEISSAKILNDMLSSSLLVFSVLMSVPVAVALSALYHL